MASIRKRVGKKEQVMNLQLAIRLMANQNL